MTNDELAVQEFLRGLELFEASRIENVPIINKILYNQYTGAIISKITTEYENKNEDLDLMDVDQTYIHDERLLTDFHVRDGSVARKPNPKLNFTKRMLVPAINGRFTTVKNNMLFIAHTGDSYDYKS